MVNKLNVSRVILRGRGRSFFKSIYVDFYCDILFNYFNLSVDLT